MCGQIKVLLPTLQTSHLRMLSVSQGQIAATLHSHRYCFVSTVRSRTTRTSWRFVSHPHPMVLDTISGAIKDAPGRVTDRNVRPLC